LISKARQLLLQNMMAIRKIKANPRQLTAVSGQDPQKKSQDGLGGT
jgi:hypothetical protein